MRAAWMLWSMVFAVGLWWPMPAWAGLRIAVLPFVEAGAPSGFEGMGLGLQSMVTTDLSQAREIEVVERARLQDILAELELAQSSAVDPTTAAKVGKLAGATHVVTGSFSAVGGTMRLDARLAEVATRKVEVGESVQGPLEEFFDLQKQVVQQLIEATGATLSAKERHQVNSVQSFDFENFRRYSEGLALYDADRYSEAVRLLEEVARTESSFTLAQVTLEEIRTVREAAEARASAARIKIAEEAFTVRQAEAQAQAEWVTTLQRKGTDDQADWQDRTVANLTLIQLAQFGGPFRAIKDEADAFAMWRMGERAYQRVWNEIRPRVPQWFPVPFRPSPFPTDEAGLKKLRARHFEGKNPNYLMSACERVAHRVGHDELRFLWVSRTRRAELWRDYLVDAKPCMGERAFYDGMRDVAKELTTVGQFGAAVAVLSSLSSAEADPDRLESIARMLASIEARQKMVEQFPRNSLPYEAMRFAPGVLSGRSPTPSDFQGARSIPAERAHYYLRNKFPFRSPFILNGTPIWIVGRSSKENELSSGPRTGPDESASLRHYRDLRRLGHSTPKSEGPTLAVFGGVPRRNLSLAVDLAFEPASDWWPRVVANRRPEDWTPINAAPTTGLLVGLTELATKPVCDPADPNQMTPVPATAVGALIHQGELVIARLSETWNEPDRCRQGNAREIEGLAMVSTLARTRLKRIPGTLTVSVEGRTVRARAGRHLVEATLPEAVVGFAALFADGEGYVELARPRWE